MELKETKDIVNLCSVLSNSNRVKILKLFDRNKKYKLSNLWDKYEDNLNITHRETFYNYIQQLVKVNLIKKIDEAGKKLYIKSINKVELIFND